MTENFVALLGTKGGPAIRTGSSMPTSNLCCFNGRLIVVDCGLGVTRGLVDQGMALKDLSLVIVTHLHSDHYLELGALIHTAWVAGLKTPVDVWGPPGLEAYWHNFAEAMRADIDIRIEDEGRPDVRALVNFHVIETGVFFEEDGLTVSAIRTQHPPLVDCFALSLKTDAHHVVFSGDTAPIREMAAFAQGADLLIHEAMLEAALPALLARVGNGSHKLMEHLRGSHTFAHDAARIASQAKVKALALSHLIPADDPAYDEQHWREAVKDHWSGTLHVGRDGMRIDL